MKKQNFVMQTVKKLETFTREIERNIRMAISTSELNLKIKQQWHSFKSVTLQHIGECDDMRCITFCQ